MNNQYPKESFVAELLTTEDALEMGFKDLAQMLESEHLSGKLVIVDAVEPNVWSLNKKVFYDYWIHPETKITIPEAKKKYPYLFI